MRVNPADAKQGVRAYTRDVHYCKAPLDGGPCKVQTNLLFHIPGVSHLGSLVIGCCREHAHMKV